MTVLRYMCRNLLSNIKRLETGINTDIQIYTRSLTYTAIEYNDANDPVPKFFNKDIQILLKDLTRVDLLKLNRKRKLGTKRLEDSEYKFMTDEELKLAKDEAIKKSEQLLQIPPAVCVRKRINKILSQDPALQGYEQSKMVFTDITYGVKDADRLIVVRETDGTLRHAEWDVRDRMNQIYFPKVNRCLKPPRMFYSNYLENLLERKEYEFILDRACVQFEPNDPDYQKVVSITYQHINDNDGFKLLRSTRHFGALTFFLVWIKNIDNLLLELIETCHNEEAVKLLELYSRIHQVQFEKTNIIEEYIDKFSNKKAVLQLGLQAHKDFIKQTNKLDSEIEFAHGLS